MLILTRKAGESIILGEGNGKVTVQVLSSQGGQIRLGITAPKDVAVHREEIYQRIHGTKPDAASTTPAAEAAEGAMKLAFEKANSPA